MYITDDYSFNTLASMIEAMNDDDAREFIENYVDDI